MRILRILSLSAMALGAALALATPSQAAPLGSGGRDVGDGFSAPGATLVQYGYHDRADRRAWREEQRRREIRREMRRERHERHVRREIRRERAARHGYYR